MFAYACLLFINVSLGAAVALYLMVLWMALKEAETYARQSKVPELVLVCLVWHSVAFTLSLLPWLGMVRLS